jgi:probable HAF family extracellular repeat protein
MTVSWMLHGEAAATNHRNNKCVVHRFAAVLASFMAALSLGGIAWGASFEGIGMLPGDNFSEALAVSADGNTVAGLSVRDSIPRAFRWREGEGMIDLGSMPEGRDNYYATAISADGSVVVGYDTAWRWTEATGMVAIGWLPSDNAYSWASGISADGSTIVGASSSYTAEYEAFRWTANGGMEPLGILQIGDVYSEAVATSADGSVVVGSSEYSLNNRWYQAFRWTRESGMVGLGFLDSGGNSNARAVSSDGSVVVGDSESIVGREPMRWTAATGMVGLGLLPEHHYGYATGVSADGSIIVGISDTSQQSANRQSFVWNEALGMRTLADVLSSWGVDTSGWNLRTASAVSGDGQTIIGYGHNPSGVIEAWIARGPFDSVPPTEAHIVATPAPPFLAEGDRVEMKLVGTANAPYSWYKDDVQIDGAATVTLVLDPVTLDDEGVYLVIFDDGTKAMARTPPYFLEVLRVSSVPVAGGMGIVLLCGLSLAIGVRKMKKE